MLPTILWFVGSLFLLGLGAWVRWLLNRSLSRKAARVRELEAQVDALTDQLMEQQNAPRTPADLADRLRRGGM